MIVAVRRHRAGFTIIELLVVVTIIGLLAGILIPSLSQARLRARRAVVATQLRRIGTACDAYQTTFGAYPGPVPDDVATDHPNRSVVDTPVSQDENLLLGLLGCTLPSNADREQPTDPTKLISFEADKSITGPFVRIPVQDPEQQWRAARNHARFYDPGRDELADPDGDGLPELVANAFGRKPILYYRAVPGRYGLRDDKTEAQDSVYDYRQNGLPEHWDNKWKPYAGDDTATFAPPNQQRLAAMLWDKANARDPSMFQDRDPCYRADSFILITTGPDGRYADNSLTAAGDLLRLSPVEQDNVMNFP